jgi:hypothetical protein
MTRQYAPRSTDRDVKGRFVTVAFDEKTRFLIEMAARKERRTVSSLINEAVHSYIPKMTYAEGGTLTPLATLVDEIWSPIASTRFVLHADRLPSTLTFEEQILWQLIQQDDDLWRPLPNGEQFSRDGNAHHGIKHDVLRNRWDELNAKAKTIADEELASSAGKRVRDGRIDSSVPDAIKSSFSKTKGKVK